ncbi:DeoR/GlpR family DNA-binding transcription regulator [Spirosoma utsteinense]|uniref:DeoR family fructose operon transcriptional repressor n=1 Tax=Spirosoma utsteinense TaxID=2585773 RepID=A0ABR6W2J1_9BACT|nr:DeoR/GlpR family DNA-binding transcription regulator [Spirosoma utsteinense]MBC3786041.1 DeoR family fructose operon transcriptional repressor [Spirosoma utsteinense]MBC3790740.1 DeoR family fructose operon transcriptional repressor [Spirosoma utsteinense]
MNFQHRKRLILQTVDERGSADVQELADLLQTSAMTIRRDLVQLAASGLIYRTRGGAMTVSLATDSHRFANKTAVNPERKDYICQLAAAEIQEGDIIFMDCGSTVFRLCPFIRHKRITVVTNSLPVVAELLSSEVTVNLVGGEVDKERQAIHGLIAEEHMARYRANRAFIGVDGISLKNGLSANGEREAGTAMMMARQSQMTYLLCDSSKLETDKYLQFAPLSLFDVLITDAEAPDETVAAYKQAGVTILN